MPVHARYTFTLSHTCIHIDLGSNIEGCTNMRYHCLEDYYVQVFRVHTEDKLLQLLWKSALQPPTCVPPTKYQFLLVATAQSKYKGHTRH